MINQSSFNTALPSASALAAVNKVVGAKPSTVLSELVRLSAPVEMVDNAGKVIDSTGKATAETFYTPDAYGHMVEATTMGTLENPTAHSVQMDTLINTLSTEVAKHVSYAKNVVRPLVSELAEKIIKYQAEFRPREASQAMNIVMMNTPSILIDESFLDTLTPYKDKSILTPDRPLVLQQKTAEELNKLVTIGHDRTDKLIVEWLTNQHELFLTHVWNVFFTSSGPALDVTAGSMLVDSANSLVNNTNPYVRANYALAILLLARKIKADVQSSDLSAASYDTMCAQYIEFAGSVLTASLARIALYARNQTLVIEKNSYNLTIVVNGDVYTQWLQTGGSPEVLLGILISDNAPSTIPLINEAIDQYRRQFESYSSFYRTRETGNVYKYTKNLIEAEFNNLMGTVEDVETGVRTANSNIVNEIIAAAKATIDGYTAKDLEDPFAIALQLIAKIRFSYTSSYQILSDIHEASKHNPNVDVREAALIAVINYVSDYVADQMALS